MSTTLVLIKNLFWPETPRFSIIYFSISNSTCKEKCNHSSPASMKLKEITLWGYTINYFFIAQLLSRQKAAISIVPLNTEGLEGWGRATLNLQESSTSSAQSPPEKLKVRRGSTKPMGSTPLPGSAQTCGCAPDLAWLLSNPWRTAEVGNDIFPNQSGGFGSSKVSI